jgi:hypothetical protein
MVKGSHLGLASARGRGKQVPVGNAGWRPFTKPDGLRYSAALGAAPSGAHRFHGSHWEEPRCHSHANA